jgi:hypothetical protein
VVRNKAVILEAKGPGFHAPHQPIQFLITGRCDTRRALNRFFYILEINHWIAQKKGPDGR